MILSKIDSFFLGCATMFIIFLVTGAVQLHNNDEEVCEKRHLSTEAVMEWQSPDQNNYAISTYSLIPMRLADSFKLVIRDSSYSFSMGRESGYAEKINYHFDTGLDSIKLKN